MTRDLKSVVRRMLTKEAAERLARVRLANPAVAEAVENYLAGVIASGKVKTPINDGKLKEILSVISAKREIKIRRR